MPECRADTSDSGSVPDKAGGVVDVGACNSQLLYTALQGIGLEYASVVVEEGDIPVSRHESYCAMMEEAKNIKEWELSSYKKHNK